LSRFRAAVAVYGLLRREGRVLLLRRKGSGYRDGQLSLPAGHLEGEEDAVAGLRREVREELGVEVLDCRLALVMHRRRETPADDEYVDLFFDVTRWAGEPVIGEPEKCSELVWASPGELPDDVVDYIAVALKAGGGLVVHGWGP
jgi:8-oxo-dGTP pyrophosphatase MutT (NUDIX family)